MKRYKILFTLYDEKQEWYGTEAERGMRSATNKPMTKEEAGVFRDMENKGEYQNIEPGRVFYIESVT